MPKSGASKWSSTQLFWPQENTLAKSVFARWHEVATQTCPACGLEADRGVAIKTSDSPLFLQELTFETSAKSPIPVVQTTQAKRLRQSSPSTNQIYQKRHHQASFTYMMNQGGDAAQDAQPAFQEADRFLPLANVARIIKNTIPDHALISKDAKQCMVECASEFISFITSEGWFLTAGD